MIGRRSFCLGSVAVAASGLAGCASTTRGFSSIGGMFGGDSDETLYRPDYQAIYAGFKEDYPVDAFDYSVVDPQFLRQVVSYDGPEAPGTIVVRPSRRMLYFVEPGGRATRYGVGVGREGFGWSGTANIRMKRAWPDWVPPREMLARQPEIRSQLVSMSRGLGVPGGTKSPLGARAMYLFGKHGDLGYRLHGTLEPWTIGTDVSSGCIRLVNQDIIHLYSRTSVGTTVIVAG